MRVIYASTLYQSPHEMILTSKEYFFIYYVYLAKKNYIISKIGHQINSLFHLPCVMEWEQCLKRDNGAQNPINLSILGL